MKASTVVPVFLFFIAASASPLQTTPIRHSALEDRARNTYTFKNCSPQDQQQLEDALDDMQTLAQAAVRYSEPTNPDPAFRAWFGDGDGVRITDQTINLRYEKFAAFKTNVPKKSVTLDCDREARCCSMSGYATEPKSPLNVHSIANISLSFYQELCSMQYGPWRRRSRLLCTVLAMASEEAIAYVRTAS
jgi:hypothetical protein